MKEGLKHSDKNSLKNNTKTRDYQPYASTLKKTLKNKNKSLWQIIFACTIVHLNNIIQDKRPKTLHLSLLIPSYHNHQAFQ